MTESYQFHWNVSRPFRGS